MTRLSAQQYLEETATQAKASKYRNKSVVIDGHRFASQREGLRYSTLKLLIKAGDYRDLVLQPRYPLMVGDVKIGTYVADFEYVDCITGQTITEDSKGFETDVFKLKRRFFEAQYGRKIRITR